MFPKEAKEDNQTETKEEQAVAMVVPTVHTSQMTPEQENLFALKNRARILCNIGRMTLEEALERNLISQADYDQMRTLTKEQLSEPLPVIAAPVDPPKRGHKCC